MTTKPKYIIVVLHDCFVLRDTITICHHKNRKDLSNSIFDEPHGRLTEKQFEVYSQ